MKNNWIGYFYIVSDGQVEITHHSTSSTIEIAVNDPDNISSTKVYLDYSQFDSLIECIRKLEPTTK